MAKSFEEYKKIYFDYFEKVSQIRNEAYRRHQEEVEEYQRKLSEYRSSIAGHIFHLIGSSVLEPKLPEQPDLSAYDQVPHYEFAEVGQWFAVQYKSITGAVNGVHLYVSETTPPIGPDAVRRITRDRYDKTSLDTETVLGDVADLWTVVEYLGDGRYKDLVSGEILRVPAQAEKVIDTVTQATQSQAEEQRKAISEYPLGIKCAEITETFSKTVDREVEFEEVPVLDEIFPVVEELTTERQEVILRETLPRKEEIQSRMGQLREQAKIRLDDFYLRLNALVLDEYYEDAMSRSGEMHAEEEAKRQEELRKQQELEAKKQELIEAERRRKEAADKLAAEEAITREFEEMFRSATVDDSQVVKKM